MDFSSNLNSSGPPIPDVLSNHYVLIPSLFFWILTPLIWHDCKLSRLSSLPWSVVMTLKWIVVFLLLIDHLLVFCLDVLEDGVFDWKKLFYCFTLLSLLATSNHVRKSGISSSGSLFTIWMVYSIFAVMEFYRWFNERKGKDTNEIVPIFDTLRHFAFLAYFPLVLLEFLLQFPPDPWPTPKSHQKENCPEQDASFISRQLLLWFTNIISLGYKRSLEIEDVCEMESQLDQQYLKTLWKAEWEKQSEKAHKAQLKLNEKRSRAKSEEVPLVENNNGEVKTDEKVPSIEPSMIVTMWNVLRWEFLEGSFVKLFADLLQFANPLFLNLLITFIETPKAPLFNGLALAVGLFLAGQAKSMLYNYYYIVMTKISAKVHTMLGCAIYEKAILLSNTARKERTVGEMLNLLSVDIDRIKIITPQIQNFWSAPLQIIICMVLLWKSVGIAVWAGIGLMVSLLPVNFGISIIIKKWQTELMKFKDERIRLTNEVLNGIKVVKLSAWETAMEESIEQIREKELAMIRKSSLLQTAVICVNISAPVFVSLITFTVYVLIDEKNVLTPNIAFVSLALFDLLRGPLMMAGEMVSQTVQVIVSNRRIRTFLCEKQVDLAAVERGSSSRQEDVVVDVQSAAFSWDTSLVLSDIGFSLKSKELISVVGSVASGKSSLLLAALGEMEKVSGTVRIQGSVAYFSQQPWIVTQSLKKNVLMQSEMNEALYKKILDACALSDDLKQLADGDDTEIGEKGINLSGGQKARIALARCVYQNKDVYFLDDPLSAVDAHVGKHIFDNVIGPHGMLSHTTRILVTNCTSYLQESDKIIIMKEGKIKYCGTYDELWNNEEAREYLKEVESQKKEEDNGDEGSDNESDGEAAGTIGSSRRHSRSSRFSKQKSVVQEQKKPDLLIAKEEAATGHVKLGIYALYFKSMGILKYVLPYLIAVLLNSFFAMGRSLYLSAWSDANIDASNVDTMAVGSRLGVYAGIGFVEVLFLFFSLSFLLLGGIAASRNLHRPLLHSVLRSPLSYFDVTPIGRIINRLSNDMEVVDLRLSGIIRFMILAGVNILQTIAIVTYSTPLFIAVIVPVFIVYYMVLKYSIKSTRQLQRLSSVTKSPIFSNFSETLQGISTIRSFQWNQEFIKRNDGFVDIHVRCNYYSLMSNRWLAFRLELLGNIVILGASILAVVGKESGVTAGLLGLSVSYCLNITLMMNLFVRTISEVESNIVSVERIEEYTNTRNEAEWRLDHLARGWPSGGAVVLDDYSCRYRDELELVLKNITLNIIPGQKVGVCGRSGAGKSSLALALFRIVEAADGHIRIDDTETDSVGLHDLREKLTIIPQENVLFANTLRFNIDPKNDYSDAEIWTALEDSHLKAHVEQMPQKLESSIAEGGENFSVGQRQLLCLTRALLRKSKVLVLDEATSGIDNKTDSMVQATIREKFAESTIITIAHRLHTIMDYDRIIVMDAGRIVEDGSPGELLKNRNSKFYGLAKSAKIVGQ